MDVESAYNLVSKAIDAGRLAHGYLVVGDLKNECSRLVDLVLRRLFPDALAQLAAKTHPDVAWLEPEGKSRTIHIQSMREEIVAPMSASSFSGGWKAGVIIGADRMEVAAANAFLKTLEEPTPRTIFLMLTDNPDAVLPTIVSRSQRIDLPLGEGILDENRNDNVKAIFSAARGNLGSFERANIAKDLCALFADIKADAEPEDAPIVRKKFFKSIMKLVREWMTTSALEEYKAFRNIEAVEEAYRQSERAIGDEAVLCFLMDRLILPS